MANLLGVQKGNARPLVSPKGRRVTGWARGALHHGLKYRFAFL